MNWLRIFGFALCSSILDTEARLQASSSTSITEQASQEQLFDWQQAVQEFDWEWVLVRINKIEGLNSANFLKATQAEVTIRAINSIGPNVEFDNGETLSDFLYFNRETSNNPQWGDIGVVAYQKDSASELEVVLTDLQSLFGVEDTLLQGTTSIPSVYDQWEDYYLEQNAYGIDISFQRSTTPIYTEEEQNVMKDELTEVLFDLEDGSKASLVYNISSTHNKAVLYLPGLADTFVHPNVLRMYQDLGYDFYSLDTRDCGRTRRFMEDSRYGHSIDDFDKYFEETRLTLDFIRNQNPSYSTFIAHCHSAGALIALNYELMLQETDPGNAGIFDGYVMAAPFLDWGYVGGDLNEFVLENAGVLDALGIGIVPSSEGNGLGPWQTRRWILNRYNVTWRPLIQTHLTTEWAQAATNVQRTIVKKRSMNDPVTDVPVIQLGSNGDDTLKAEEIENLMPYVSSDVKNVRLEHNAHDVFLSFTKEDNDIAVAAATEWLQSHFCPNNQQYSGKDRRR